ncbi:MAG: alpha/beta fold hydrolase [Gemmatimonadetes bacterium]|nr:alpha/beta fold hydrolase [Gemmatimonadota bacterium]
MPIISVDHDQQDIHYRDTGGGGVPLVLIHGFPFNSESWSPQIAGLSDRRLIVPDLRGFGETPLSAHPYTLARLADDVAEILDALSVRRAVVGGLSMGGYVTFEFWRRHRDRVAGLLLADTRPQADSDEARLNRARLATAAREEGTAAVTGELLPKLLAPVTRQRHPEIEERLRKMMNAAPSEAVAVALMAMAARDDSVPILATIDAPTLVIVGSEDAIVPPADTREWAARIPDARLDVIAGAGHVSNLERPDTFNQMVADFLDGLEAGATA